MKKMPDELTEARICPLQRKCEKIGSENYRGIKLLPEY